MCFVDDEKKKEFTLTILETVKELYSVVICVENFQRFFALSKFHDEVDGMLCECVDYRYIFLVFANWKCWEQEENEVKPQGWRSAHIRKKQEWQNKLKNLRIGRKEVEDQENLEDSTMAAPFYDENLFILKAKQEQEARVSMVTFSATGFLKSSMLFACSQDIVCFSVLNDYIFF